MVQARYGMGWVLFYFYEGYWLTTCHSYGLALIYGILNCATMIGFMALTAILAGQCLALASNSTMSWDVGIVIAALIALIVRKLHSSCLSQH